MGAGRANRGFKGVFERSSSYRRASVVLPFLAISIALGALAYRSYHLSVRMEQGLDSFAVHYLAYAAEVTARRADVAASSEMFRAAEQWQQTERDNTVTDVQLRKWVEQHPWITSAIYVPDDNPVDSMYVTVLTGAGDSDNLLTHEFFTSSGSVRYTYSASRLLALTAPSFRQQSVLEGEGFEDSNEVHQNSKIEFVRTGHRQGLTRMDDGFAIVVPLAEPLNGHGVRASVKTSYVNSGWASTRAASLWLAGVALLVVGLGAYFAVRGLKKESEAMNLRAALIANVSHELRTPLAMIRLGAETLKRSDKLRAEDRASLEDSILREVVHLNHLVENVLDVARLQRKGEQLSFASLDPEEFVRSLITTYEPWITSRGFHLQLEAESGIAEQRWDREGITRAVLNLLDNAMKYSTENRELFVSLYETTDSVVIAVKDHGVGIASRELTRIFEPYYRASFSDTETRRGAGLGLTLVHQIVTAHGGRIDVDSKRGEGSTFRLIFPKQQAKRAEQSAAVLKPSEAS